MSETPFEDRLAALVSMELSHARRDADRMGVLIERLAGSLGLVIAAATRGNAEGIDEMIAGAEGYIHSTAVERSEFIRWMERAGEQPLPPGLRDDDA